MDHKPRKEGFRRRDDLNLSERAYLTAESPKYLTRYSSEKFSINLWCIKKGKDLILEADSPRITTG